MATGSIGISSYTRTDATREAVELALNVLYRLRTDGIGSDMLKSAQNYILGRFPTELETASQLAAQFAMLELYGLGRGYVEFGRLDDDPPGESLFVLRKSLS